MNPNKPTEQDVACAIERANDLVIPEERFDPDDFGDLPDWARYYIAELEDAVKPLRPDKGQIKDDQIDSLIKP